MELGSLVQTLFPRKISEDKWYSMNKNTNFDNVVSSKVRTFNSDNFNTPLTAQENTEFNSWVSTMKNTPSPSGNGSTVIHPKDNFSNYDMQGYWKDNVKGNSNWAADASNGHFTDKYKKPNHPTFSVESKYATGNYKQFAGKWTGNDFTPARATMQAIKKGNKYGTI